MERILSIRNAVRPAVYPVAYAVDSYPWGNNAFVFEVKTTTPSETFSLPLEATGTYDFVIDWGDGQSDTITEYDQAEVTHTYASAGTYIVRITGTIKGFRFANTGDRNLIYDISSIGPLELLNTEESFNGCNNLTISAIDPIGLTGVTSLYRLHQACISITDITYLLNSDTSLVQNFSSLLSSAVMIDQDLGSLNIASATNMANFLFNVTMSTENYSNTLIGFADQPHQDNVTFDGGNATYNAAGAVARAVLIADGWTITDGGPQSLGSDIVVDGDFPDATNWTLYGAATISGGTLNINAAQVNLARQDFGTPTIGDVYHVTFDVSAYVSGGFRARYGNAVTPFASADGSYEFDIVVLDADGIILLQGDGTLCNYSVDNLSIKKVLP